MSERALDALLGRSPGLEEIRRRVVALVGHGSPRLPALLIEGETGTGKGLLARAIHEVSSRSTAPFVDVNCAAIPETLLEAELFGYAAGAFSSARRSKPGLITVAHGGTLFLDELGALPLTLQAKLLTAVEEQQVRPLGSTRSHTVDVWVLSATSEGLEAAVREGRFRRDLYHRLARLSLRLPPLRERGDDILLLARHFLVRTARDHGATVKSLASDACNALMAYAWPGNVRELANLMERLTLLGESPTITATALELPVPSAASRLPASSEWGTVEPSKSSRQPARASRRAAANRNRTPPDADVAWLTRSVTVLSVKPTVDVESPSFAARERALVRDKIEAFGGILQEADHQTLLAVFGFEPSEDAPLRAAHAAMAVLTAHRKAFRGVPPAIAALDVFDARVPETGGRRALRPDDAQTALDRLASLLIHARPGEVVAGEPALPHLERAFDDAPVPDANGVHRIVRARGTFAATRRRSLSPWVGREHELRWLARQVERLEPGQGRVIGFIGEPGVGKSRLLHQLHEAITPLGLPWREGRCVSHGTTTPYLPLIDLLRRSHDLEDGIQRATLATEYRAAGLDLEEDGPYVERLLGLPGGDRVAHFGPETIRSRTFEVLHRLLQPGRAPVVVAIEDVHWIDRTSQAFLNTLVDAMPAIPLVLIVTYRAGYRPPWIDRSTATQLAVRPLDATACRTIVSAILRPGQVDDARTDQLVQQAEGNPFFLEELAWGIGSGDAAGARAVPRTIHDAVSARIDRLPASLQLVLGTAALLGREAPAALLGALVDHHDTLARDLDALVAHEFLLEQHDPLGRVYVFKHALTHDVAYDRLPLPERQRLHAVAAREIEHRTPDGIGRVLANLAHHWSHSDDDARAVDYLVRFADSAAASFALEEALEALERGLQHAERLPAGPVRELATLGCVVRMGLPLLFVGRPKDALGLLLSYRERLAAVANPTIACLYHFVLSGLYDHLGELGLAFEHSQRAINEADRCGDVVTKGRTYVVRAQTHMWRGELASSVRAAQHALPTLLSASDAFWTGMCYWTLGLSLVQIGDLRAAEETGRRLLEHATLHGDHRLECYGGCIIGIVQAYRDGSTAALETITRAIDLAPDPLARSVGLFSLGEACLEAGAPEQARQHLQGALGLLQGVGLPSVWNWAASFKVAAEVALGNADSAHELANRVLAGTGDRQFPQSRARVLRALARLGTEGPELVGARLAEALQLFEATGARFEAARARLDLARFVAMTDLERREHLQAAAEIFRTVGASRYGIEAEQLLAAGAPSASC